jgi:hypothetical protein
LLLVCQMLDAVPLTPWSLTAALTEPVELSPTPIVVSREVAASAAIRARVDRMGDFLARGMEGADCSGSQENYR